MSAMLIMAGCGDRTPPVSTAKVANVSPLPATATATATATPTPTPTATATPIATPIATPTPTPTATHLAVKRLVIAHGVKEREPVDPATSFDVEETGRVYAFVEVENPERAPGAVYVSFEPPRHAAHGDIKLDVGASPRWRTWAFTRTAREPGEWTAVIRNDRGEVLARQSFQVG